MRRAPGRPVLGEITGVVAVRAHLVGWSYGADVVLVLAVQHPELVRSLFLYEPAMATFVSNFWRRTRETDSPE